MKNLPSSSPRRPSRLFLCLSVMAGIGLLAGCPAPLGTILVPEAPEQVTATASHGSVSLSWGQAARATAYKVQYQQGAAVGASASTITVTGTQASLTGLAPYTQYSFTIKASNSSGESAASLVVSAVPLALKVLPPLSKTSPYIGSLQDVVGGSFFNGTATVTVSGFRIMRTLVTGSLYDAVMGAGLSGTGSWVSPSHPVQFASWYDSLVFCNRLSLLEGLTPVYSIGGSTDPAVWIAANSGSIPTTDNATWNAASMNIAANGYRLPTEAEWMWAAMGGLSDGLASDIVGGINTGGYLKGYAGSKESAGGQVNINNYAWTQANTPTTTQPVGTRTPNELGLYDMSGNVSQWCFDWQGPYPTIAQTDPMGPATGASGRITRGGAWDLTIVFCALGYRDTDIPSNSITDVGFRVVRR